MAEGTLTLEAPAETDASPQVETSLSESPVEIRDANDEYESRTFGGEPEEPEGETEAKPEATPTPSPEATSDELTPDELARFERSSAGQARIKQLADNVLGNRLQTEKQRWEREFGQQQQQRDTQFDEAGAYYTKLVEDEEFFAGQVTQQGRPKVLRWMADYQEASDARADMKAGKSAQPAVDVENLKAELIQGFNVEGARAFAQVLQGQSFYSELPERARKKIEAGESDPAAGHWVADWVGELGRFVADLKKENAKSLDEARKAGRNEAIADHQEAGPVVTPSATPGRDPREVERLYSLGDSSVSRTEFRAALKALGKDY
jgi:hypothetical protein